MTELSADLQQMLVDSQMRWAQGSYDATRRAQACKHEHGCPPDSWRELGHMGWLSLLLDEEWGGMGAGADEVGLIAEGFGRVLLQEPYVACGVMAISLINSVAKSAAAHLSLNQVGAGDIRVAFAAWEPGKTGEVALPEMQARQEGDQYILQGSKEWMSGVAGADFYLVLAGLEGNDNLGLFLLPADSAGVGVEPAVFYDGCHAARLTLVHAKAVLLQQGAPEPMLALVNKAVSLGLIAYCAELAGAAQTAFTLTRDYVCERRQFGKAVGSNQVVQHRLVDLYILIEEVQALWRAAAKCAGTRNVAALMVHTQTMADQLWQESLQLHGAIGMTAEYSLAGFLKRLAIASTLFGQRELYLEQLAALELEQTI